MAVDFGAALKKAEEEGLTGGGAGFFKIREGDNRIRLCSECLPHQGTFQGKKNFKWLCYVLDRKDGQIKPMFMANTIYKQIVALQQNPDYEFVDVPMPYDLTINAKGAGTVDVVYTVVPARKNTELTTTELTALNAAKPLADIKQALKDKQAKQAAEQPPPDDDINFDPRDLEHYPS
jgi:hypothetical protein